MTPPLDRNELKVFDCPKTDKPVTLTDCAACSYFMSHKKCGWLKDGKRGNGKGEERYYSPKKI